MNQKDKMILFSYQMEAFAVLEKWSKAKKNKDLNKVIRAFDLMYKYQMYMEAQIKEEKEMFSDYREKKNREVLEKQGYE
jgi:hypothetical protein